MDQQTNLSRVVSSPQTGPHQGLVDLLKRQAQREWAQPLHQPTVAAFEAVQGMLSGVGGKLVLDSGCGTGESTRLLAAALPDCTVIGVDKSMARLARTGAKRFPHVEGNAVWVRADLTSFWRLALRAGWKLERHYLLYPNPWPKPSQLQRRWHAHPVFPDMLRLGGRLEMRCNWEPYALEFAAALNFLLGVDVKPCTPSPDPVLSPFERKYRRSGHELYSVTVSADSGRVK